LLMAQEHKKLGVDVYLHMFLDLGGVDKANSASRLLGFLYVLLAKTGAPGPGSFSLADVPL